MRLKVRPLEVRAGRPIAFMHEKDAQELRIYTGQRIVVCFKKKQCVVAVVDILGGLFPSGNMALSKEVISALGVPSGGFVDIEIAPRPAGSKVIQQKRPNIPYTYDQLKTIIKDIVSGAITEAEIAYFVSDVYRNGLTFKETLWLTQAIAETGVRLRWQSSIIADKHSIGGVPGNRTTPLVVSICAAAGLVMPKTSSRAITSPAGTADVIESIARVDFDSKELLTIVKKVGACLAWGGSLGLAPADDKLIQVERIMNLDPEPQLIASILAKKLAVGSTHVLIDIPSGDGAKVTRARAFKLADKFKKIASQLNLTVRTVLTNGEQPIGHGIGPILEIRDVLKVLRRKDAPLDLEKKSIFLAGNLLELTGHATRGTGEKKAKEILDSGRALAKFVEIIEAQGGTINHLPTARYTRTIRAHKTGTLTSIDNKMISQLGRLVGCPHDKAAGLYIHKHIRDHITKGEPLLEFHAESETRLKEALAFYTPDVIKLE